MSDSKDGELAIRSQAERDNDPEIVRKVCREINNSLVPQYSWRDLLQSVPFAISATGACIAAYSSDAGQRVMLKRPTSGSWKYLENESLAINLALCGDKGRIAFVEAETGLSFVKEASARAENKVNDMLEYLQDPQYARKLLGPQMKQLKASADDCFDRAMRIDKKFDEWLMFTSELHATCVSIESDEEEKLRATELTLTAQESRFDPQQNADPKAMSERLGKQLTVATAAFKKASDELPKGWNMLGRQIVGGLAECIASAISSCPGYTSDANSTQPPLPPCARDPAYSAVQKDMPYLEVLNSVLTQGDGNGVNWDAAVGEPGMPKCSIDFLSDMLADAVTTFDSQTTSDPPSATLRKILSESVAITKAVSKASTEGRQPGSSLPGADNALVKDWQQRFQQQYIAAYTLVSTARSLPGVCTQGIPIMADNSNPAAITSSKTAQAASTMESARNRLFMAQETSIKTQEVTQKSFQILAELADKLTHVDANVKRLTEKQMGFSEIKASLKYCIQLIVNVKRNIVRLCTMFKSMSTTIDAINSYIVSGFLADVTAQDSGDYKSFKIGDYTLSDLVRTTVFHSAITLRAHFSIATDIGGMWGKLSQQYVIPGMRMLDMLAAAGPDPNSGRRFLPPLQDWANDAARGIRRVAEEKQAEILNNMAARIDELKTVTKQLVVSEAVQRAITEGTNASKKAREEALVQEMKARPILK